MQIVQFFCYTWLSQLARIETSSGIIFFLKKKKKDAQNKIKKLGQVKSRTASGWQGRSGQRVAAIHHGKWAGVRICNNCQAQMKGGPLSSQPSKLVWPHKTVCVMNGGDLDQTGRKYVCRKAYWIGFYATILRRAAVALVTSSVPRTDSLSIHRGIKMICKCSSTSSSKMLLLFMHKWIHNIICLLSSLVFVLLWRGVSMFYKERVRGRSKFSSNCSK